MADNDDVSGTPDGETPTTGDTPEDTQPVLPPDPVTPAPQPVMKARWRDRVWSFRAMLAVALATLVIGGLAGGSIVALSGDGDHMHRGFMMGPGGPRGMGPGWGPRKFGDGGPQWRRDDQNQPGPMMPYGGQPTPPTPTPTG